LRVLEINDQEKEKWNDFAARGLFGHVFQSFEWGEIKKAQGWQSLRFLFENRSEVKAAAQILSRKAGPGNLLYCPRGPIFDPAEPEVLREVVSKLCDLARDRRAIFLKIDPDIERGKVESSISDMGFTYSPQQVQPVTSTLVIDLSLSEEELLAQAKKDGRYNIRLAERSGVEVRAAGEADLPDFYRLYCETSQRAGFVIRPYSYYHEAWNTLMSAGLAKLFMADYQGQLLAGAMLFCCGRKVLYMYGASSTQHRKIMPTYLLQWRSILWAKEAGFQLYDMGGIPEKLETSDPMYGVYHFKASFGGEIRRLMGAYDFRPSPWLYRLWMTLQPRYYDLLRFAGWIRKRGKTYEPLP